MQWKGGANLRSGLLWQVKVYTACPLCLREAGEWVAHPFFTLRRSKAFGGSKVEVTPLVRTSTRKALVYSGGVKEIKG